MNRSLEEKSNNHSPPVSGASGLMDDQDSSQAGGSPLKFIHRALQGRYIWAALLGSILGVLGGYYGYNSVVLKYKSSGLIRIKPTERQILYRTEESRVMPMFEQYVQTQLQLISSHRVIDMAIQNEAWREIGLDTAPFSRASYLGSLTINRHRSGHLIAVSC